MCTFLVSAARGREASGLDDMMGVLKVGSSIEEDQRVFLYLGPLGTNVGEPGHCRGH